MGAASTIALELKYILMLISKVPSADTLDELFCALDAAGDSKDPGFDCMHAYLRRRAENSQEPSLESEWTHLFGGVPVKGRLFPPYEGCWADDGSAFAQSNLFLELKKTYREGGFAISEKGVRPDELRVQIEFVSRLLAEGKLDQAKAFCRTHLSVWFPRYANDAEGLSTTGFYQGVFEYLKWVLGKIEEEEMHE